MPRSLNILVYLCFQPSTRIMKHSMTFTSNQQGALPPPRWTASRKDLTIRCPQLLQDHSMRNRHRFIWWVPPNLEWIDSNTWQNDVFYPAPNVGIESSHSSMPVFRLSTPRLRKYPNVSYQFFPFKATFYIKPLAGCAYRSGCHRWRNSTYPGDSVFLCLWC